LSIPVNYNTHVKAQVAPNVICCAWCAYPFQKREFFIGLSSYNVSLHVALLPYLVVVCIVPGYLFIKHLYQLLALYIWEIHVS